jgi:xylulokinase
VILALDLGSTTFKGALFGDALDRAGEASVLTPYRRHDIEAVEMDADAVCLAVVDLIGKTCRSAGVGTTAIASVALTSQAQNFTILDADGRARMPIISWLDSRSRVEARELNDAMGADWHRHCSFASVSGQMQLAHLLWTARHMPEVLEGDIRLVSLPGLVFHMLSGANLTDDNLAAMSGVYSLRDNAWRADALAHCGFSAAGMPRLVPVGSSVRVPTDCAALALPPEIRLVSAGNDQTSGAFGNGCREGDVIVTLGTALVAYRYAGMQPGPFSANGCWGPYPGGGYYELAVSSTGCLALDWAREVLMPGRDMGAFAAAVGRAIPTLTDATGTFHPSRMRRPDAWEGEFANPDQKAYAVLEGITRDLRDLVFETLASRKDVTLTVIGGGSRSDVWLQLIADLLECRVRAGSGDSLLGAAAMAAGAVPPACPARAFSPGAPLWT